MTYAEAILITIAIPSMFYGFIKLTEKFVYALAENKDLFVIRFLTTLSIVLSISLLLWACANA